MSNTRPCPGMSAVTSKDRASMCAWGPSPAIVQSTGTVHWPVTLMFLIPAGTTTKSPWIKSMLAAFGGTLPSLRSQSPIRVESCDCFPLRW